MGGCFSCVAPAVSALDDGGVEEDATGAFPFCRPARPSVVDSVVVRQGFGLFLLSSRQRGTHKRIIQTTTTSSSSIIITTKRNTQQTGGLSEAYDVKHLLGSGSAGDAWLCQERSTGDLVAVKLIKRPIPPLMGASIMREVKIGAELGKGHLNIVKPREVVLTR